MPRVPAWVLPRSRELGHVGAQILTAAFWLLVVLLAVTALNAITGIGGRGLERFSRDWLSSAIYLVVAGIVAARAVRLPDKQVAWAIFAFGLCLYGLGNILWSAWIEHLKVVPIPSVCDGLWLSFYPLSYVGIVGFARGGGHRQLQAGIWLDGLIAGSGLAAIGAAVVFHPVLANATGDAAAVTTELGYPVCDLLLVALVVGVLALRGWRLERAWSLLGGGFVLMAVADCMYALQVANGASMPTALTNLIYVGSVGLMAVAAWQPAADESAARPHNRWALIIPAGFTLAALGLFQYDHLHPLDPFAFALADVTLTGALLRTVLTIREIRGLAEVRQQASTDDLTSLPNRRAFMRQARTSIARARAGGRPMTVIMMDLDNFKELNDTLGHGAGDTLLKLIGPRIQKTLRSSDVLARLGGDEFAMLLESAPDHAAIGQIAHKILAALTEPFEVGGLALRLTASLGIATYPADGGDEAELLSRADIAMYQAKTGRNRFAFYSRERDPNSLERLSLASELAHALQHGGMEVHFQPKARAMTREIIGVEALVRWRRPDGRLIPPDEFIRAAEHAGLSRVLTRTVLDLALAQMHAWRRTWPDLHIAVNTTVADLLDLDFPAEVAAVLARYGLPAGALVLEVTESSVLSDPARIGNVLAQLRELGIGLSLDDFGTGYSSLVHLRSLPVGEVKIDRSFVRDMCTEPADEAIVSAIAQLAQKLEISVAAEGVEDEATWQALQELGCDVIQGYALSRPVPPQELEALLRERRAQPLPVTN